MCKKVKYEVVLGSVEFKSSSRGVSVSDIIDLYYEQQVQDTELIGSFDSLEDAKACFADNKYKCSTYSFSSSMAVAYVLFLDENVYVYDSEDEEWSFDSSNGSILVEAEPFDSDSDE